MPEISGNLRGKAAAMLERCPSAGRICSSPDAAGTDAGLAVRRSPFAVRGSRFAVRGSRNTISRVRILHMAVLGAFLLLLPLAVTAGVYAFMWAGLWLVRSFR
jgi:hypothetical protein